MLLQKFVSSCGFQVLNDITMTIVDGPTDCSNRMPGAKRMAMRTIFAFFICKQVLDCCCLFFPGVNELYLCQAGVIQDRHLNYSVKPF